MTILLGTLGYIGIGVVLFLVSFLFTFFIDDKEAAAAFLIMAVICSAFWPVFLCCGLPCLLFMFGIFLVLEALS